MKKQILVGLSSLLLIPSLFSYMCLSDIMTIEEQQKTGVYDLNHNQKQELEKWINDNFIPARSSVEATPEEVMPTLTFELILSGGKYVQLSNGTLWEIAPDDIVKTSVWLIPFPIAIKDSSNADFPNILMNLNTGDTVKARAVQRPHSSTQPQTPSTQP